MKRLSSAWQSYRDVGLLLFCGTVYAVTPVAGFAWLLLAMGVAQVSAGRPRTLIAYLAGYLLILAYREIPWMAWL